MSLLNSIIFDKQYFTPLQAAKWVLKHRYTLSKIDVTKNSIRIRQMSPDILKLYGYKKFRTVQITTGVKFILAFKS